MNKYEEMFLMWFEEQKAKEGLVSVNHSTSDGDNSSEEFFKEACEINNSKATIDTSKEKFPQFELPLK